MSTRAERQPTAGRAAADVATSVALVGLAKRFGDVDAVRGIDLEIRDGEFFSMLGPSGSGKTTVLRLVAGFEEPTAGRVLLGGKDVSRTPPFDRDVNTVFQDYALFPHMSVLQNVAYGLRVKGVRKADRQRRAVEALDSVQLADFGDRKPSQLSGGQRQRVALARALVNRPRVLLLDEPLGALDLKLRQQMQIELKRIQRDVGITFLFVTHDQDEALTMSDRLAVFNEGRIEQVGTPAEVYESPATPFVAGFVGTANLLRGDLARGVLGTDGVISIRPERVRVTDPDTEVAADEASADGVVREVVYAGALLRYVVDLDAGTPMIATQPNTSLSAAELASWQGRRTRLIWKREHALAVG